MKKIIQLLIVCVFTFGLVNNVNAGDTVEDTAPLNECVSPCDKDGSSSGVGSETTTSKQVVNPKSDLSSESFVINVGEITPGGGNVSSALGSGDVKNKATNLLEVIISILILPFGVLAIISMTIGGGIMIFSGGRDELLTRGKTLLKGSLIALSIALLSGAVMQLISNLLFK